MRLSFALPALLGLLPLAVQAANPSKWAKLAASSSNGVIKLNSESYEELVASPREYSVSVVLTALPVELKCEPCRQFKPSFELVSSSWRRLPKEQAQDHFFASLDFPDGQDVYRKLNLNTAPTLQFFPPTEGPHKGIKTSMDTYDFARSGFSPEALVNYLTPLLPHTFEIHVPFNPAPLIFGVGFSVFALVIVVVAWPYLLPIISRKEPWMFGSLAGILIFTSGHMWNKIRNAPFATQQGWMAPGFQQQYGLETQLVAMLYGALAITVIILTHVIPHLKGEGRQQLAVVLWMVTGGSLFALLLQFFKWKNGGYPYTLF